jgi:hypothetical protein
MRRNLIGAAALSAGALFGAQSRSALRRCRPGYAASRPAIWSSSTPAVGIIMTFETEGGQVRSVEGSKGTSPRDASREYRAKEAEDALGWYASIVADSLH